MQWSGKYAIYNHLAKLAPMSLARYRTNLTSAAINYKKRPYSVSKAVLTVCKQICSRLLLLAVSVVAGRVLFFVLIAANQATANYASSGTHYGSFAAAQQATSYRTRATANGGTFGFVAPTFFRRLRLSAAQQHEKSKNNQKICFEDFHDERY